LKYRQIENDLGAIRMTLRNKLMFWAVSATAATFALWGGCGARQLSALVGDLLGDALWLRGID